MFFIIKLYDLLLEAFKTEVLEYLNNFNLVDYPYMSKIIENKFDKFITNSSIYQKDNLIICANNNIDNISSTEKLPNLDISKNSYFVFNYCGHSDDWIIHEFKNLKDVDNYILEEYNNIFTTYLFVFIGLKRINYIIKENSIIWLYN